MTVTTIEVDFRNRNALLPALREPTTIQNDRRLEPIQHTKQTNVRNPSSKTKTKKLKKKQNLDASKQTKELLSSWAEKVATRDKPKSQGQNSGSSNNSRPIVTNVRQRNVVFLSETSKRNVERAAAAYGNTGFRRRRLERIDNRVRKIHETRLKREFTEITKEMNEKLERNVTHLKELKDLRDKYFNEKQRRVNRTYVSLAALEMPEVNRYAYGLPPEGKEFTYIKIPSKANTKEKYKKLWKQTMKKASSVAKMLQLSNSFENSGPLPVLKLKRPKTRKGISRGKQREPESETKAQERRELEEVTNLLDEIKIISPGK